MQKKKNLWIIAAVIITALITIGCPNDGGGNNTTVPVGSVTINPKPATMLVGDTQVLTAVVLPGDASDKSVTWSIVAEPEGAATLSGTTGATVTLTAEAKGSATITVASNSTPDKTDSFTVSIITQDDLTLLTADDFTISANLTQSAGTVAPVTVTAKDGKTEGTITVLYDGSPDLPQTKGTYPISINVAQAGTFASATALSLDVDLVVNYRTIRIEYFVVTGGAGGHYPVMNEVEAVTVQWGPEASSWNGNAAITVFYVGTGNTDYPKNTVVPQALGTYNVVIDVAGRAGYFNAVQDLNANYAFTVGTEPVVTGNVDVSITVDQFKDPAFAINTNAVFSLASGGPRIITLTGIDSYSGDIRWTVNGGTPVTGTAKTLDVSAYTGIGNYSVMVEIFVDNTWYNKTFTFRVNP